MSDNARVAAAATTKNGLPLDELTLIGLFGTETDRRALVRHASGKVQKVQPGERVGGRTVVGITSDGLLLKSGGGTRTLAMPAG